MAIEKTAQLNKEGKPMVPGDNVNDPIDDNENRKAEIAGGHAIDWQGLTPATNKHTNEPQGDIRRGMGEEVVTNPQSSEYGRDTANRTPMPPQPNPPIGQANTKPKRGSKIRRSARPTKQDEKKVDRLTAPDWRGDQPLPSAKNAIDPRGENTPEELKNKPADNA